VCRNRYCIAMIKVYSHGNQVDHYPLSNGGDITILPGWNDLDKAVFKDAAETTAGNRSGLMARVESGMYEVRKPQVAIKKRGTKTG